MKNFKFLSIFLILVILASLTLAPGALALEIPEISSNATIVINTDNGDVLYSKNSDVRVAPASTTKIMTVLLAIEAINRGEVSLQDQVTASNSISYDLLEDGSSAGITAGETMSLESLLYCAMVSSANEACNVIAEYIGGTIPTFIEMMNVRAAELGCQNTHFANTHGLPHDDHYSTAEDFALITAEAASHGLFMELANTPTIELPATNVSGIRKLNNSNALICDSSIYGSGYIYDKASGIKTGFTNAAGYCLISTATNGSINLLTCVFGGVTYTKDDGTIGYTNFSDTITLDEWVFNNYSYQDVLTTTDIIASAAIAFGSNSDHVNLRAEEVITALLPNDFDISKVSKNITIYEPANGAELSAPIAAGEVLGEVTVSFEGIEFGTAKLIAASSIDLSKAQYMKNEINTLVSSTPFKVVVGIILFLILAYIVLVIRYRILHARHKRAVREARMRRERAAAQARAAEAAAQHKPLDHRPTINYFAEDDIAAPVSRETKKSAIPEGQSERDYFEEFFRQKK
ncbi:MAG: D-alanyl-D-alanine carboxypeptidase [Oscillospiraceae bacterium]|nr:D-alanyl-D-alanine carboxypeptidase [Oscillospiraceae bacterium]